MFSGASRCAEYPEYQTVKEMKIRSNYSDSRDSSEQRYLTSRK